MPSYSVANLEEDLVGIVHSTSLSKIQNKYSLYNRVAKKILAKLDSPTTKRVSEIIVHSDIYDYSAPTDLKGNKIIDIRPQVSRQEDDSLSQQFSKPFDLRKLRNKFHIAQKDGVKRIRLSKSVTPVAITLHLLNGLTDDGTWAADGIDASNLTKDTVVVADGNACLNFDLLGVGTTGYIENSTFTDVDLTDHDELSKLFAWVYFPDTSIITNVILMWGNDSSNYWSVTATTPHDQSSFKTGWNLIEFDWNGATETGTVDPETIDFLRVTITYDGTAETDIRVDKIWSSIGQNWEVEYYSKYLFQTSAGAWQEKTTDTTDVINLDTDAYNIFTYECALSMAQQQQGEDSRFDISYFKEELYGDNRDKIGLYQKYAEDNPSEAIKPRSTYYRL